MHKQLRQVTRKKLRRVVLLNESLPDQQGVGWWVIAIIPFYTTRVMCSILHYSPLLPRPYNNPYIEPRNWMSEICDDISRDGDKNIKHENSPKIKNNSQLQMHIEYPPPPTPTCRSPPFSPSDAKLHNLH